MLRRLFLSLLGATALAVPVLRPVAAETWPARPVKLVVPYAPGGASDIVARPWADALTKAFGQPFVIDNRGGAAGAIGTEAAVKAPPDGYTMLLTPAGPMTVLPHLRQVNYDPIKDLQPVARVGDLVCGFTIVPDVGINSMKELIDYAKKNPGKIAYGSPGLGSSGHMRIEMLKYKTKADILHVPYRGSADALNDLLSGTVQLMNEINVIPHIKAGKLKLLAINYPTRHPDFPDVPTMTEAGIPDADVPIWYAIFAPAALSKDIVATLNKKVVEIAGSKEMIDRMRDINVAVPLQTPAEIEKFRADDSAANGALIKAANVKLE